MEPVVQTIPEILVCERVDGKPLYYKGYQEVLNGTKQPENIMGSSYLQSFIVMQLILLIARKLPDPYRMLSSEVGLQLGKGHERNLDIGIFLKEKLKGIAKEKYVPVAPEVVIEVDIKVESEDIEYLSKKTDALLAFGVKKVIWVLTKAKKVVVAEHDQDHWQAFNWDKTVNLIEGISVNIKTIADQIEE